MKDLPDNITQTALPAKVVTLLQELSTLALAQQLTPLDFSGLLVRCLSALVSSLEQGYSRNVPYAPTVFLGKRKVSFTLMDYQAILSAKQIINDHPEKDITIHSLSKEVFLNERKTQTWLLPLLWNLHWCVSEKLSDDQGIGVACPYRLQY